MTWEVREGDALAELRKMRMWSVQTVVTSPPYWGLRDYGVAGQLGLEPTPDAYVSALVGVFREVWRVLRDDGTVWLNLGDCYAASRSGPAGEKSTLNGSRHSAQESRRAKEAAGRPNRRWSFEPWGLKPKDLVGIPWRVALALQADGWWLRSDIVWSKPNPMPESVTDRPTKAHEYLFLLTKSARYFYDADAVRQPAYTVRPELLEFGPRPDVGGTGHMPDRRRLKKFHKIRPGIDTRGGAQGRGEISYPAATANLRTVWTIPTEPFAEAHFATFPKRLVEPCVRAASRPGDLVLDPFAGSGTTGLVALRLGRSFVGIELSSEYAAMARNRIEQDAPLFNAQEVL